MCLLVQVAVVYGELVLDLIWVGLDDVSGLQRFPFFDYITDFFFVIRQQYSHKIPHTKIIEKTKIIKLKKKSKNIKLTNFC